MTIFFRYFCASFEAEILNIYQKHKYEQQLAPTRGLLGSSLLLIYSITAFSLLHRVYSIESGKIYKCIKELYDNANRIHVLSF